MSLTHCAASRSGFRRLPVLRIPLMVGLSVALTVPALTACQEEGGSLHLVLLQRIECKPPRL